MSQLLRPASFCQRLTVIANIQTSNILRCRSCEANWGCHISGYGKSFSVKVTTLAQKYRDNSQAKKVKTNSMIEHNKQEHFKDLLAIIQKAKTQFYATKLGQVEQTKQTTENQLKQIDDSNENTTEEGRTKKQRKTAKKKSSAKRSSQEADTQKLALGETTSLGSLESLPQVKTVFSSKKKSKELHKRKSMSKQKKKAALAKLLVKHPFLEDLQNANCEEVSPHIISELESILQNDTVSPEISEMIHEYLDKIQGKKAAETDDGDLDVPSATSLPDSSQPLWRESDLGDPEHLKEVMSNVIGVFLKDVNQQAKQKAIQMDAQRQLDMYHREVTAYVDACVYTGNLRKAHHILIKQTQTKKKRGRRKKEQNITDVNIYNRLMHAYAKQVKLQPIRQLFQHMEERNLDINLQSYAAVLECLGRIKSVTSDITEKVLQDIEKKAIKSVKPSFEVDLGKCEDLNYNCNLLNDINSENKSFPNPYYGILSTEELKERTKTQLNFELSGNVMVESIEPSITVTSHVKKARKLLDMTREKWRTVLRQGFQQSAEQLEQKKQDDGHLPDLVPFLRIFPVRIYVDIMMQEITMICQEMQSYSPPLVLIHKRLGQNVFNKLLLIVKQKQNHVQKVANLYDEYIEHYNNDTQNSSLREIMQQLQVKYADGSSLNSPLNQWPISTCKVIGRFLMSVIMNEVKVNANMFTSNEQSSEIPAFYSITRSRNNIPQEEVMPHPLLVRLHKMAELRELQFDVSDMPSIVPPMPWTSVHFGGNLLCTTKLVKNAPPQFDLHEKVPSQQLYPIFDALNTVGSVPWIINQPMLDVLIEVFNKGGDPQLDIPQPVSKLKALPIFKSDMTPEERTAVILERLKLKKKRKEMYSLWCTELYRLSIANKYRDEVFWFPHNVDFRSRFYAVPPHFNHLGSDVARSLLMFAKGKELGPHGLDWLKIHLINLTGFKKRSPNRERLQFANENIDKILDSADRPLTGEKWWKKSDEPWQTLACCKEIANAIKSPDPTKYTSHYPVHQDGSCNGLQHYAALGRDLAGAQSVNLYPFDRPKDVYSDVVELVEAERKTDANTGKALANVLDGFVRRKVIKQTIMTTVYGVTKYGARQQIRRQLEDLTDFPQEHVWASMAYLTDKTFYCLQQMFTSTKHIQDWLVACAELTSRVCYEPVKWVTPVGWPVLQPYYKVTYMSKPDQPERKIAVDKGVTFVAVHDCFWTHACDIDLMNKACRQEFVALHKEPILENLADFLLEQYGFPESEMIEDDQMMKDAKQFVNRILSNLPERGVFDIDKVSESTYFFS
ncbi:hypothetical protein LSH36_30g07019 [Paralvinella palmiformis]|uniref:DNA-directed RNA polymerase n=1 Tax=Paralvinella palmiformis TaxID=53620 RepID=A0AAD9KA30_9ANNE|nr:hypothetical protein LSH36_30g07019 [Paralvinella palmiformis]